MFAAGNFIGPLLLGRLFDTVGRRPMIAGTYLISAVMLAAIGIAFNGEVFSDWGLTLALGRHVLLRVRRARAPPT